ncbi:MAG: MFS transporter [Alistipes sp.]|nr:MFS transporter [Alistipes sp.]
MASLLIALIYLAFISLGLPDSLLGSALPSIQDELSISTSVIGLISMVISMGTIVSSLMSERLIKRFGTPGVTVASVFLTAAALFGFSISGSFLSLCLWAVPYGLGAGSIDAALNNYVSLHYSSRHMNWLHCFWGVGTIISPYIMSAAISSSGWHSGYRWIALVQSGIFVVLLVTLPVWRIHSAPEKQEIGSREPLGMIGSLRIKGVPSLLLGFFAYCAAEATAMLWSGSYLHRVHGFTEERSAALASLFFIGMTAGRFISGLVSSKLGDRNMIRLGCGVAFAGIVILLIPANAGILPISGLIIVGLGCAPVYPSIIHATPENFGEQNSQGIIGIQMASAYTGTTLMPTIFGAIAQRVSLRLMPVFMAVFLLMMIILIERTFSTAKNNVTVH